MKKHSLILLILLSLTVSTSVVAQDKIYSLTLKQHEIEEAIRKSLDPFLNKKDYVVKVKLTGRKKIDAIRQQETEFEQQVGEALPGFELESETGVKKITDVVGNTYWQITRMRIDLIMHKEISPSVDTFIRETVPVVSELNPSRGDLFNFVPILPQSIDEAKADVLELVGKAEKKYYGLTRQEWLYVLIAAAFVIVVLFLIWRLARMRSNLLALEEAIEEGKLFEHEMEPELAVEEAKKEKEQRLAQQEELIRDSILVEKSEKMQQDIITHLLGRKDWAEQLYGEFAEDRGGVEKMAQFVSVLGPATSRRLFADIMGEEDYLEMEGMALETKVNAKKENELLSEIQKILYAKKLTSPERMESDPFTFLHELTTGQVAFLIKDEPVKIKSIVLSQLNSVASAQILSKLSKDERAKVITQLGNMDNLPLELAEKVAYNLADKAKGIPGDKTVGFDGVDMVVEAISESDANVRKDMINSLRVSDRKLSEKVESRFFLFDSIPVVPNDVLIQVVRTLPPEDVITSIVGTTKQLQEKVIMCFPEKNRRTLVSSLKSQTPTVEMIKAKQKLIIRSMQKLAADNKIDLRRIQAAWEQVSAKKPSTKKSA